MRVTAVSMGTREVPPAPAFPRQTRLLPHRRAVSDPHLLPSHRAEEWQQTPHPPSATATSQDAVSGTRGTPFFYPPPTFSRSFLLAPPAGVDRSLAAPR